MQPEKDNLQPEIQLKNLQSDDLKPDESQEHRARLHQTESDASKDDSNSTNVGMTSDNQRSTVLKGSPESPPVERSPSAQSPQEPSAQTNTPQTNTAQTNTAQISSVGDLENLTVGHYAVGRRLGSGGTATVYEATDEILDRVVALKVLMPGADHVLRQRFRREARTASHLHHPHVVRTIQVGETSENGLAYIAMELIEGESLSDLLEAQKKLGAAESCALLEPIARALSYAHRDGVIHRDVKPSNILLRPVQLETPYSIRIPQVEMPIVPLLSDFGIARALDSPELTNAGRTIGTPTYMAPEQCAGSRELDGRADIYALGTVLYRCLVGRPPFVGATTKILHAHVYEPLMIPDEILQESPPAVIHILRQALMKDPNQRYPNADIMADEMAAVASQLSQTHHTATATMESLPTTDNMHGTRPSSSQMLVPGLPAPTRRKAPLVARNESTTSKQAIHSVPSISTQTKRFNWLGLLFGIIIGVLILVISTFLYNNLVSFSNSIGNVSSSTTPVSETATAVAQEAEPVATSISPPQTPDQIATANETPISTLEANTAITETNLLTATVEPTPVGNIDEAWDNAVYFYQEQDWAATVEQITFIRRIDPNYKIDEVNELLFNSYQKVSEQEVLAGNWAEAVNALESATNIQPNFQEIVRLREALNVYANATEDELDEAKSVLEQAYIGYADSLAQQGNFCGAARQLTTILKVQGQIGQTNPSLEAQRDEAQNRCSGVVITPTPVAALSGQIIYSTMYEGRKQVLQVPVLGNQPTLLVENATQPHLSPNRSRLAYFGVGREAGLLGVNLTVGSGFDPNSPKQRFTEHAEDSRDSPPSWNPNGDQLIYSSTNYGDDRHRIYTTWTDGSTNSQELTFGKDPAWHPLNLEQIVYNGASETGQEPGLWIMDNKGKRAYRLTDHSSDLRPTWSPDGETIVFMSSSRDGNWEVYKISVTTGTTVRLTNHPAQDGLPTISPDGQFIAFVSDRAGYWQILGIPIDGGQVQVLADIRIELPLWLEYAIQWVN